MTDHSIDLARAALARARAYARASNRSTERSATSTTSPRRPWRVVMDQDEEVRSGPAPDARDPQPLGGAINALVSHRGWHDEISIGSVIGRWIDIVGADIGSHVHVESFVPSTATEGATLVLRTDSTAWATQIRLLLPALRRRLDEELGHGVITNVRIQGPSAPSWRKGAFHVPGRGPRDTYG